MKSSTKYVYIGELVMYQWERNIYRRVPCKRPPPGKRPPTLFLH